MKTYITFGQIHVHANPGGPTLDKDCIGVIEHQTNEDGHELAMKLFDAKFHHAYSQDMFDKKKAAGIMDYYPRGLIEVNR